MHHNETEIVLRPQKRLPYRYQIVGGLRVQRYPWPDAGVNENIIALPMGQIQPAQKRDVGFGQSSLPLVPGQIGIEAPAPQRVPPAGPEPVRRRSLVPFSASSNSNA